LDDLTRSRPEGPAGRRNQDPVSHTYLVEVPEKGLTARVHGMIVVTRNVKDFERAGVQVLNPFAE
jgi:hypothetical protein